MDFRIEEVASAWLAKKDERATVLAELRRIEERIALTKKIEPLEREYAEIAGLEYKGGLSELERRRQELREKLEIIEKDQQQLTRSFFEEVKKLTLPLPPRPTEEDRLFVFKYREGKKFTFTITMLEELLRLKPLNIENVAFKEDCLEVKAAEEFEAKRRVISAIKELKSLAEIYFSPQLVDICEKLGKDRYRAIWETILSKTSATLQELSRQTGQEYEKVRQACYDLTRKRCWKPFPPPVKVRDRGVYELTLAGRIIGIRYYEAYRQKRRPTQQHPPPKSPSLNRFLRGDTNEN